MEREKRERIERENQILLRKILDCHHGVDRSAITCHWNTIPAKFSFNVELFCWPLKNKTKMISKNPSRGRTSTIPRLPERFGGQDSSRLAGGAGPGRGEQVGQQGREDESSATGGEETDRSTSTALTSAGLLTDWEGPSDPCIPSYSFAIVLKHNSLTLP